MASRICSSCLYCMASFLLFAYMAHSVITPKPTVMTPCTTYVVHTDHLSRPPHFATQEQWHASLLGSSPSAVNATGGGGSRILYTYGTVMHGFAAVLAPDEARRVAAAPGVLGVYQDRVLQLQTTRSPGFLGLDADSGVWPEAEFGDGVVIGIVDTGIWPESASFNDIGLGPIRPGWRGECVGGERFDASLCNNKLVGARFFTSGAEAQPWATTYPASGRFLSPRDGLGHGTHTASTAAGSDVPGAGLFGFARGTARGTAPKAKVAVYKACVEFGCIESDVLRAIDAAVEDGVDIISMSIGGGPTEYYDNAIAIGTFAAVRKGIFVACAAGNGGPSASSVSNIAPWVTTVGAGTVDRAFPASVVLGNGEVLIGESLYAMPANQTGMAPLVLGNCTPGTELVPDKIMGKIAACTGAGVAAGIAVQAAGGAGLLALSPPAFGEDIIVQAFTLPAITLGRAASEKLAAYAISAPYPIASFRFTCETAVGKSRAPMVPFFSSRGPSPVVPEILKPDVVAPGLNILAAWPPESPLAAGGRDPRRAGFNILSGTSMSCPHVAGAAALLRRAHPDWSPAAIRSALATTAATLDNELRPIADGGDGSAATPLSVGAGLVRPQLARDPGLVYDAGVQDYVALLCALNYTEEQLRKFAAEPSDCPRELAGGAGNLNYPSFVVAFGGGTDGRALRRRLRKVSEEPEAYDVRVVAPDRVAVAVTPARLEFEERNEEKSYVVEFRSRVAAGDYVSGSSGFGYVIWENEVHQVKSPVVFLWK